MHLIINSLKDVVYADNSLYMIFEYLDYDLKKYMKSYPVLSASQVKVRTKSVIDVVIHIPTDKGNRALSCT